MAPGLPDLAAVQAVCSALTKPVNFMAGIKGKSFSVADLSAAGVRRISLASSLYRVAMGAFIGAAKEAKEGTFGFTDTAIATPDLNAFYS
jgi:2-methylisocitrate lyase-like PEP mutase family enzyme